MMQCLRPLAPSDEELLRHALDGEALSLVAKEHLEHCTLCQQRLASYAATNSFVLSRLYRSQCPDATTLSHYCTGMLSMDETTRITGHLEICPLCTNEVAETRLFLATLEPLSRESESTPVLHALDSCVIASPTPWQPQSIGGNSSAHNREQLWPRHYQADIINVSLHLIHDELGNIALHGLLSSKSGAGCSESFMGVKVELYAVYDATCYPLKDCLTQSTNRITYDPLLSTHVDDLNRIVFASVPSGPYLMIIYLPGFEVVIEELKIHLH